MSNLFQTAVKMSSGLSVAKNVFLGSSYGSVGITAKTLTKTYWAASYFMGHVTAAAISRLCTLYIARSNGKYYSDPSGVRLHISDAKASKALRDATDKEYRSTIKFVLEAGKVTLALIVLYPWIEKIDPLASSCLDSASTYFAQARKDFTHYQILQSSSVYTKDD